VDGGQPDLYVEGVTLPADKSDVLLELLHSRQSWRKVLMGFGRLFSSLGCVFTRLGRSIPSLGRLLLKRHGDDTELICLGALLGHSLVGLLDQSSLTRKRHPHAALMADE
jgi:hypothetical protein